ncbi:MAG: flagellar motor protein MotB [bacterium]|nr:flagellar motor protein MotB [bacterium]
MAKKKKKGGGGGEAKVETAGGLRWLITYADMITLLLGVFIILCSGGAPSESEMQKLTVAFENVFAIIEGGGGKTVIPGPVGEKVLEENTGLLYNSKDLAGPGALITRKYTQSFKGEIKKGEMEVKLIKDAMVIRCSGALLFEHGSALVKPEAYPTLERIALLLSGISNKVAIEGHTDATPIQTSQFPSNWELSTVRATNVLHYLIGYAQRSGFDNSKIEDFQKRLGVFGYAQFHPAVEDPYAKINNRIDIVIYHHKTEKELL